MADGITPGKAGAPLGNKNALKLRDPQTRQEAYTSYCDHIALGNSKDSWYFEHEECGGITWETMENYMKDQIEFPTGQIKVAKAKSFAHWEGVLHDLAEGRNKDANCAAIQMIMRCKFGWDRQSQVQQVPHDVMHTQEMIILQLNDAQAKHKALNAPNRSDQVLDVDADSQPSHQSAQKASCQDEQSQAVISEGTSD